MKYLEPTHQVRSSCSAASAGSTLPTPTGLSATSPTASTSPTGNLTDMTSLINLEFMPLTLSNKQPSIIFYLSSNADVISGSLPPQNRLPARLVPGPCPRRRQGVLHLRRQHQDPRRAERPDLQAPFRSPVRRRRRDGLSSRIPNVQGCMTCFLRRTGVQLCYMFSRGCEKP